MKKRNGRGTKNGALLNSVAESIGSALGTLAAKADAAQKALTHSSVVRGVEREAKKVARKRKSTARRVKNRAARTLKRSKAAKATRRELRRAASSAKRAAAR
jgi:hypothetical protein